MKKIGILIWPLAALIGAVSLMMTAPGHNSAVISQTGTSSSLLPS